MSTGLIAVSVVGVTQLGTDGGQKSLVENVFACMSPGRPRTESFAVEAVGAGLGDDVEDN